MSVDVDLARQHVETASITTDAPKPQSSSSRYADRMLYAPPRVERDVDAVGEREAEDVDAGAESSTPTFITRKSANA